MPLNPTVRRAKIIAIDAAIERHICEISRLLKEKNEGKIEPKQHRDAVRFHEEELMRLYFERHITAWEGLD